MEFNKKSAQNIFKGIFQKLFKVIYGNIEGIIKSDNFTNVEKILIKKDNKISYNIFKVNKGRLYTDRINDTAVIYKNNIIEGPSFQFRIINSKVINAPTEENIVLKKGTPRIKKTLKGNVLSLLTGGGGNDNYWHWLFDVLPRLGICEDAINLNEINYFLLPNNKRKFQIETLEILGISKEKMLSSLKFRHIICDQLYSTTHPVVLTNNATEDIKNIPKWISNWLKKSFLNLSKKKSYKKIYIDRGDSISNVKHLRTIINEDEIKKYLINHGFQVLKMSELDFMEQVSIFNNADTVVGLHGAGFANTVFAKENTKIIEIKSKTTGDVIKNLAISNNLNYKSIECDSNEFDLQNQYGHINVPINKLKDTLE